VFSFTHTTQSICHQNYIALISLCFTNDFVGMDAGVESEA